MGWFKRSDGVMFEADEGSPSFDAMSKDGSFERVPETAEVASEEVTGGEDGQESSSDTGETEAVENKATETTTSEDVADTPTRRRGKRR